jgi:hypothetical protein
MKKIIFVITVTLTVILFSCMKSEQHQKDQSPQKGQSKVDLSNATNLVIPNGTTQYIAAISSGTRSTMTISKTSSFCTITTSNSSRIDENFTIFSYDIPFVDNVITIPHDPDHTYWFIPFDNTEVPRRLNTSSVNQGYTVTCSCTSTGTCQPFYSLSPPYASECKGTGTTPCDCCTTILTGYSSGSGSGFIAEFGPFSYNGVTYNN